LKFLNFDTSEGKPWEIVNLILARIK